MRKLYRKGTVHPSPPPPHPFLSVLPAAILALAASLSVEEKQLLAYLLSCSDFHHPCKSSSSSSSSSSPHNKHLATDNTHTHTHTHGSWWFSCYCFSCYTRYWSRWDSSPNRQLIHEILEAFEDHLMEGKIKMKMKMKMKKKKKKKRKDVSNNKNKGIEDGKKKCYDEGEEEVGDEVASASASAGEKEGGSAVRKMMSYVWESLWG